MTETRDKILKALRDVPGVEERNSSGPIVSFHRNVQVYVGPRGLACVTVNNVDHENATLAEAVAALTPPSVPRKPTYEYVAGLKGGYQHFGGIRFNGDAGPVDFIFHEDATVRAVFLPYHRLATPQTEPEVLATLRMCRVEVGK